MNKRSAECGLGRVCAIAAFLAMVAPVVLSLALGLWPRAGRAAQELDMPPSAPPAKTPDAIRVNKADAEGRIVITGELRAARYREILAPRISSGFANAITYLAPEGEAVKKGQRIIEFDASLPLSQKSEIQRRLDEAELKIKKTRQDQQVQRADLLNEVAQAEASLKVTQLYSKIAKDLIPANDYQKHQVDWERAKLALDRAKERLANLEANMPGQVALVELEKAQAEVDLKKADADLALLQVDAPQDGIIIYGDNWTNNRKVQVGDTLFPSQTALILPDLSSMEVIGFVYDTELRLLSPGMTCELRLDAIPGKVWGGKIESITSVASRKNFASQQKVFKATIRPDQTDSEAMKPGMAVRVDIPVSFASQAVLIPREFLGLDRQGQYCVRKGDDPGTAVVQPVRIGAFTDRMVQILSGLKIGDRVQRLRASGEGKP